MASNVNVSVLGNIGRMPDVQYTNTGQAVVHVNLATNNIVRNGMQPEPAVWYRCTLWGIFAQNMINLMQRGDIKVGQQLLVCGTLEQRMRQDDTGQWYINNDVNASSFTLTGPAPQKYQDGSIYQQRAQNPTLQGTPPAQPAVKVIWKEAPAPSAQEQDAFDEATTYIDSETGEIVNAQPKAAHVARNQAVKERLRLAAVRSAEAEALNTV